MYYWKYDYNKWNFIIIGDENGINEIKFLTEENLKEVVYSKNYIESDEFFNDAIRQLDNFFDGKIQSFNLNLNQQGTNFQNKVWNALTNIPFGQTKSYKDIAIEIGNEKSCRAVGLANNKNRIPIVVPCHRVIGSNGKLVGFAGGLDLKMRLLNFEKIMLIYHTLLKSYGPQNWWPAKTNYEIMVGAVLTQNTSWTNVEKAIQNLGDNLTPKSIENMDIDNLANAIKSSGYYNQKAMRLKRLTHWFKKYDYNIENVRKQEGEILRKELLDIKGVGKETADSILTYALDKPSFVIDTYTRRIFSRIGFNVPKDYDDFRLMIEDVLKKDLHMYGEYHGLIVNHCKEYCTKIPKCNGCPLHSICKRIGI